MTDVFKDFLVVIESPEGSRIGSLTPDEFRASMSAPKTYFLADLIKTWNDRQERWGYPNRARLEMRTKAPKRRRR